ncbi:hypothetical protein [Gemmatimonas groenlandica]|uniref:Uncharacterized protein n=1 Tax=Gemmatimonas groenlandica TaxID=2732249 RepID=A0A6M4IRM7_9BACT|nr:hypothetical protein [Gemmatimonas groenlandica]QJR36157.1 hypothetical protein HKW67_11905 [Gemmatimonas groenlandica]
MTSVITAQARVVGIVRGREIDTSASVTIDQETLVLAWQNATPWRLSLSGIEGIAGGPSSLTVYLVSNDVLELSGDDQLRPLGLQLLDRACAMPELTRGLKSLGSSRGTPIAAHDRWFAPFLAARRSVEGVSDPARQVMLLDAAALTKEIERAIAEIAATKAPGDAAEQRAVEAAIEEEAAPVFAAIEIMGLAGDALRGGALDTRIADWRRWVETVRGVFAAADDAWTGIAAELR